MFAFAIQSWLQVYCEIKNNKLFPLHYWKSDVLSDEDGSTHWFPPKTWLLASEIYLFPSDCDLSENSSLCSALYLIILFIFHFLWYNMTEKNMFSGHNLYFYYM